MRLELTRAVAGLSTLLLVLLVTVGVGGSEDPKTVPFVTPAALEMDAEEGAEVGATVSGVPEEETPEV